VAGVPDTRQNLLGEFLRARRELTRPEDHGLPDLGHRRVPGLRREEVAMLAGISAEYYLRLERGRDRHPSAQVVEALARVLDLDDESTTYLASLAAPAPRSPRQSRREPERAGPDIIRLLDGMPGVPAFVLGRCMDVLAYNRLAERLCGFPLGSATSCATCSSILPPSRSTRTGPTSPRRPSARCGPWPPSSPTTCAWPRSSGSCR
jgi:transcriptional regulator with XRE-family HTH domain